MIRVNILFVFSSFLVKKNTFSFFIFKFFDLLLAFN